MPSTRMRQINHALRNYMAAAIMRQVEWPAGVVVSVTKIHTTADLHHATVYLSVLPDNLSGSTLELIRRHSHDIIAEVVDHITFHTVPKFRFIIDSTERKAAKIESLLDSLKNSA